MKDLNHQELQQVAGGDYQLDVTIHVESSVAWAVSDLFARVVTGNISNTTEFMDAMNNYISSGANFNLVRVETVTFTKFN